MLTVEILRNLWPNGNTKIPGLIEGIARAAPTVFPRYGLNSNLVIAHAMAQFSHECGAGLEMVENINYSAERAVDVWPSRFTSAADCYSKCDSYAGDPQFHIKLIDHVYGGRMGNAPYPSHDGSTYIGRGLSQVTGKEGYQKLATRTGLNVITTPSILSSPTYALECGVADFVLCGCLPYAEKDDIDNVTLKLNGGHVGLLERKAWLTKWKPAMAASPAIVVVPPVPVPPIPTPIPEPIPPVIHPKHATGIAAVIAGIVAALQQHSTIAIIAIVVAVVVVALLLHFFWPTKKGP